MLPKHIDVLYNILRYDKERINNFVYSIEIYITKIVLSTPFTYS